MTHSIFFLWSIADAWAWLTHVPVLGFVLLCIVGWLAGFTALYIGTAK